MVPADHSTLLVKDASTTHSHTVIKAGTARAFSEAGRGEAKCRSSTVTPIRVRVDNAGMMKGHGITDRHAEAATVSGTTSRANEMGTMLNQLRMANRAPLNSHPHPVASAAHALTAVAPTRFPLAASLVEGAAQGRPLKPPGCGTLRGKQVLRPFSAGLAMGMYGGTTAVRLRDDAVEAGVGGPGGKFEPARAAATDVPTTFRFAWGLKLFSRVAGWDHECMGENTELGGSSSPVTGQMKTAPSGHRDGFGSPITQQMRIVGQRRRDAEEKLEHHLQEARTKHPSDHPDAAEHDAPAPAG